MARVTPIARGKTGNPEDIKENTPRRNIGVMA
jgi:hypothetical protein